MGQAAAFPVLGQAQNWKLRPFPVLDLPKSGNCGRVSSFGPFPLLGRFHFWACTKRKKKNKSNQNRDKLGENSRDNKHLEGPKLVNEFQSSLGILIWNLHGLKKEKIDIFRHKSEPLVQTIFNENEVIYITETWKDKYDTDCLCWDDNFIERSNLANRECKTGRSSGVY